MKHLLVGLAGLTLLLPFERAEACGSMYIGSVYVHDTHPDRPYAPFAAGQLGVLRESYRPMYLAYAWRAMVGIPTTPEEQREVVATWARLQGDVEPEPPIDEVARWHAARREALASPARTPEAGPPPHDQGEGYLRIQGDAFVQATRTAEDLTRKWTKHPLLLAEWVANQDAVFGECRPLSEPAPSLDEGLPAAVRTRRRVERDYQVAAAAFYCGRFDDALAAFRRIAEDTDSPYRARAAYLVARTRVRQALMETNHQADWRKDAVFLKRLTDADATISTLLATPRLREFHGPARRLRGIIRSRTQPAKWACELPGLVLQPGTGSALATELGDLGATYDLPTDACEGSPAEARELFEWLRVTHVPHYLGQDESRNRQAYDVAVARWKKNARQPWLVTALLKARVGYPGLEALLTAAAQVPVTAPGGLTLAYRAAHLLRERGDLEAARARLSTIPPELTRERVSSDNLVRSERLLLARGWEEALSHATWRQVGEDDSDRFSDLLETPLSERSVRFSAEAENALDPQLTARRLGELARRDLVPAALRRRMRWTAFARAAVVGDDDALHAMAKALSETEPAAKAELVTLLERPTAEERQFEARLLVMGLPALSPFLSGEASASPTAPVVDLATSGSWWCRETRPLPTQPFSFASEEERSQAASEWKTLTSASTAVAYFAKVALAWAKDHPDDPRAPIALYRTVRASKLGCAKETPEAREAFRYLHKHYGKSPWAKRAPYVY